MIASFFSTRELRRYPLFVGLIIVTIFLGTIGLTGISIVSQEVKEKLNSRAQELLTSDIAITARRELSVSEKEVIRQVFSKFDHATYEVMDIYSMVTHKTSGAARLVEIRAVEEGFPFYGKIKSKTGKFEHQKLSISKDLQSLWTIHPGDELAIGEETIVVEDVILEDSSLGLRGFSLAPRIYLPIETLKKTGLLKPGATGNFAYHFRLRQLTPEEVKTLKTEFYSQMEDPSIKVMLPENSSQQTGRVMTIISNFMSLSALVGMILSLVGVFYLYQSHLMARLKDLCLLNLHGLHKKWIILGIMAQFTGIFLFAFVLEVATLVPAMNYLLPKLSTSIGLDLEGMTGLSSLLKQLPFLYALGLTILIPLLMGLLRTPMGLMLKTSKMSIGRFRFYDFIPFVLILWSFCLYLSDSLKIGNIFFGSLVLVFVLSTIFIQVIQHLIRKFIKEKGLLLPNLETGIALRNFSRSGHKLTMSFLSLAIGVTLISLILQLDRMLQTELSMDTTRPGLFIFDIQDEQMDSFAKFAEDFGTPVGAITPLIRGRVMQVNGKKFVRENKITFREDDDNETRQRSTGLNLTSRSFLSPSEKIVEGTPFKELKEGELPGISLEKRWSERMGISLGDKVTLDIQGVEIEGVVINLREVKWTSFYPNFFVNVQPGILDDAPKTYLAILPAGHTDQKMAFQREAVSKFPNISFIDVEEIIGKLAMLFEKSRQAIQIISFLSLGVGLVILYGLSHDQVYRRYYDLALMKSLGLNRTRLQYHLLIEFGALFILALIVGMTFGWLIAQMIGKEVFKLPYQVDWERLLLPALFLTILCLVTILLASWRAVRAQPRELLSDA